MSEKKKKVPQLRFPGFSGEWEERKLGQICEEFQSGKNIKAEEIKDVAAYPVYGGNGLRGYTDTYNHNGVYALIGRQGALCGNLNISSGKAYFTEHAIAVKANDSSDTKFLFYLLGKMDLGQYSGQSAQPGLAVNKLIKLSAFIPNYDEQKQISEFFVLLDRLITLHQRKLTHLQARKKGLLQKMFPKDGELFPELRFPGFTDAWEERKWSETVDISTEMVDPRCGDYDDLPHVAPGNIESFTGQLYDNVKSVKDEKLISGKFHFRESDVIYGKINPQLGKYVYATFEGLTSADVYVLNTKNNLNQKFLFVLLQTNDFFNYSVSVSKRTGMPKINRNELNAYSFFSPSIDEQDKIGSMFLRFNRLITLHQRKLDHLQTRKKALLQQLFV